jgi:hypothetical protein
MLLVFQTRSFCDSTACLEADAIVSRCFSVSQAGYDGVVVDSSSSMYILFYLLCRSSSNSRFYSECVHRVAAEACEFVPITVQTNNDQLEDKIRSLSTTATTQERMLVWLKEAQSSNSPLVTPGIR